MQEDATKMQLYLPAGAGQDRPSPDLRGSPLVAEESGFLQAIGHERLVTIAASSNAVITLIRRPGHFIAKGETLGLVFPPAAAAAVSDALERSHIVGPNRTLTQDLGFAIDQLVEIAIRALSPAVNDTFTALNCIDWLGDCLCRAVSEPLPDGIYRDRRGIVRLVEPVITIERLVKGATDKIRQAGSGTPAVLIRQLENFSKVLEAARTSEQGDIVLRHAEMILHASEETVPEAADRRDVRTSYEALVDPIRSVRIRDAEA
jgi:uncharacterized membrane protein